MTETYRAIIRLMNLLEKTVNSETALSNAANRMENNNFRRFLLKKLHEKKRFTKELEDSVKKIKNTPDFASMSRRGVILNWLNKEFGFNCTSEKAFIDEVEYGDKRALGDYELILQDDGLPYEIKQVLHNHKNELKEGMSTYEELLSY